MNLPGSSPALPETSGGEHSLGDFTAAPSLLWLVPVAIVVGVLATAVAWALLDMIGFLTNLLYFGRLSARLVSPWNNTLGWISVLIPIGGGLVVGLIARFGSDQIRGHGIPEAIERILINGSSVQPKLAVYKPIASAIAIGTGGPFGAEGPIILTGGAVGSIVGQLFKLTAVQRRSLLVAGASAGMAAVFGTPVAATLFGVELLVFEFKPRSTVLIGLASVTADALRLVLSHHGFLVALPLFQIPAHPLIDGLALVAAAGIGVVGGAAAWLLTVAVYGFEDLFLKLRGHLHWMWWPTIGGVFVGIGGMIDPRALGVGYNEIHLELLAKLGVGALLALFIVKLIIWASALGSGTSGGILAPLLMMGAALGGALGHVIPFSSPGVWAEIGMAAALAGVTRSPFTSTIFAFELTHDANSLLAVLTASMVAHLISVLVLKRSILTEKVARRGFHVMREYAVDPLEATFVREVMETDIYTVEPDRSLEELHRTLKEGSRQRRQRLYPVLSADGDLLGALPWSRVLEGRDGSHAVGEVMISAMHVAFADEILRPVADRMAEFEISVLPVVDRANPRRLEGLITQFDLLRARQKLLVEERHAERLLLARQIPTDGSERPTLDREELERENADAAPGAKRNREDVGAAPGTNGNDGAPAQELPEVTDRPQTPDGPGIPAGHEAPDGPVTTDRPEVHEVPEVPTHAPDSS